MAGTHTGMVENDDGNGCSTIGGDRLHGSLFGCRSKVPQFVPDIHNFSTNYDHLQKNSTKNLP